MSQSPLSSPGLWESIAIGVLVLATTFMALRFAFPANDTQMLKTSGVFAGAAGLLVTLFLLRNPAVLERYSREIVIGLLGILLVFIAFLRRVLRR